MRHRARTVARCLGIVQLLLTALAVRAALFSFARLAQEDRANPLWDILRAPPAYKQLLVAGTTLEIIAILLALASGLGLLGLRRWAWWTTVAFCVARLVAVSVQGGNFYFNILKPQFQDLERTFHSQVPTGLYAQPMLPFLFGLLYPGALLVGLVVARGLFRSATGPRPGD